MTQQQRRKKSWAKWRQLISQQARGGQSVAAFCRERGLCAPHFFQWKKRLSEAATEKPRKFVEVRVAAAAAIPEAGAESAVIEIRLKNDRRLLVRPGFDAQHLQALLAILESRA